MSVRRNSVTALWVALFVTIAFISICFVGYLSWRIERWFNWKYDYGDRVESSVGDVEQRLIQLEVRVSEVEKRLESDK